MASFSAKLILGLGALALSAGVGLSAQPGAQNRISQSAAFAANFSATAITAQGPFLPNRFPCFTLPREDRKECRISNRANRPGPGPS